VCPTLSIAIIGQITLGLNTSFLERLRFCRYFPPRFLLPFEIAMPTQSPRYTADVQRQAAEQVLLHRRPISQIAKQLCCSPQSVKNWIEKYQKSALAHPTPSPSSHMAFLPVQVGDANFPAAKIELVTKNGLTLRFPVETHPDTLFAVAKRFEGASC
jgi:transposase-like protein